MSQACNSHAQARQVGVGGAGILDRAAEVRERQTETVKGGSSFGMYAMWLVFFRVESVVSLLQGII